MRKHATNPWVVLVLICLAQFMVVLDATIVNVALPSIQNDLHLSEASLQWIVNAYTLVFGGFLLLGGRAGDLLGRKRLFLDRARRSSPPRRSSTASPSSEGMLIGARALQGLGAALISPAALSIISTTFAEGKERARALGVWAAIAIGGSAVGLDPRRRRSRSTSRGRGSSSSTCPSASPRFVLSLRLDPRVARRARATRSYDLAGAVTVTGGLMALVYAIVDAETARLGLGEDARLLRARGRAARGVRRDRAARQGAARAALDLPAPLAR